MKLSTFILKRLILSIGVLIGLSILIFVIARVVPGDPVRLALGARAPQEVVEKVSSEMHLDKPYPIQYVLWLKGVVQGDFGMSLYTRRNISEDIKAFLPATLELALFSGIIMTIFGILLGVLSVMKRNTWLDHVVRVISYLGVVTPAFVFAIFFVLFFGYVMQAFPISGRLAAHITPPPIITGMITVDSLLTGNIKAFLSALTHLFLPALALSMAGLSQQARIARSSMSDNLQKDYILAHRACGISEQRIMFKYLLKPSLIPTVSILGLDFAALLSNAFLVELVFNWPGISRYGINAILRKDLNAVAAVVMILGITFVLVNIIVDIVVAYLDPRIRMRRDRTGA
ncbi:MAG: ABC transporter permease [Bacillota bacterium]|nr:ABC transporter permease [Bacillota bacterium]